MPQNYSNSTDKICQVGQEGKVPGPDRLSKMSGGQRVLSAFSKWRAPQRRKVKNRWDHVREKESVEGRKGRCSQREGRLRPCPDEGKKRGAGESEKAEDLVIRLFIETSDWPHRVLQKGKARGATGRVEQGTRSDWQRALLKG